MFSHSPIHAAFFALLTCVLCGCENSTQIDCQIVGHSMATAFKSQHSVAFCDQCGFEFACDVTSVDSKRPRTVFCGNCGSQNIRTFLDQPADKVSLHPGSPVRRWDVVAFRRGDRVLVKRVIGMPGDIVDFNDGNLLINGRVVKKPTDVWSEIASCVFDSNPVGVGEDSKQLVERIVPRTENAWGFAGKSIVHRARKMPDGRRGDSEFDFLDYRHRKCYKNSNDPSAPVGIDDSNPFNQSIRRTPHSVDELDVRVEVSFADIGAIRIQRQTPKGAISATVELHDDQTVSLQMTRLSGGDIKTVDNKGVKISDRSFVLRLVNFDDLIHLYVDGMKYVEDIRFESIENPERYEMDATKPVVSLGVSRADSVTIERVSIWRDWYLYQEPPKPSVELPLDMGNNGYYVVGDNLPVSEDSRHFGTVHDIIGVVKPIVAPSTNKIDEAP